MQPYFFSNETVSYLKNSTYNAAVNLILNVTALEGGWPQFVKNMGVGYGYMRANFGTGVIASAKWGTLGALQYWRIGTLKRIKELNRIVVMDQVGQGFGLPPIEQWASRLVDQMGLTEEQLQYLNELMRSYMQGAQSVPVPAPPSLPQLPPPPQQDQEAPDASQQNVLYLPPPGREGRGGVVNSNV